MNVESSSNTNSGPPKNLGLCSAEVNAGDSKAYVNAKWTRRLQKQEVNKGILGKFNQSKNVALAG